MFDIWFECDVAIVILGFISPANEPPDLTLINQRIRENIGALNNFRNSRQPGRSRKEYLDLLLKDLCAYYGYGEFLMEKFMEMFQLSEVQICWMYEQIAGYVLNE